MSAAFPIRFLPALAAAGILFCGPARAQEGDSTAYYRVRRPWLPVQGSVGVHAGFQVSRFRASSEYRALVEPVPAEDGPWTSPSWGASFSLRWKPGFTLAVAPRRETYGLRTGENTVSFAGNPYPHTLEARTELTYNVWPVLAGWGWFGARRHFQVQAGWYTAWLDEARIEWIVDGRPYDGHPQAAVRSSLTGWMLAAEYGWRLGPGELSLGIETQRAAESSLDGLKGGLRPEAAQARMGYAWILWD